ncbi:MAG: hypothetical protein ACFFBD_26095 [Candidatus Hodarchaeota archaeon]
MQDSRGYRRQSRSSGCSRQHVGSILRYLHRRPFSEHYRAIQIMPRRMASLERQWYARDSHV